MLVRAMSLGLKIDCIAPSSFPLNSNSNTYDFCAMVPLQLQNSIDYIDNIHQLVIGGAPISKPLIAKVQGKRASVYETYGMTETITHVAIKKVNLRDVGYNAAESTFKALPGIIFSLDSRNCLVIDAPKISDDKIVTNDVVDLISDSKFKWLARFDNTVNSGGIKLFPEQIEALLSDLIIKRFFVTGIPDTKLGEKLVLFVEDGEDPTLMPKIQNSAVLSKYQLPKKIYFLKQFKETENEKINRQATISQVKL